MPKSFSVNSRWINRRTVFAFSLLVVLTIAGSVLSRQTLSRGVSASAPVFATNAGPSAHLALCDPSPVVTINADGGAGSLRMAIVDACSDTTITFDMSQVVSPITLTSGELVIDKNLTIQGPTTAALTIGSNLNSRIFNVNPGITALISSLTISNGRAAFGGGVYNQGTLTIIASTINGNASANGVDGGAASNGTNGGDGGGLYNSGTLKVINSTISGNNAGNGGNATGTGLGGNGGNGGGIYNEGTLLLINDSISQNRAGRNGLNTNGNEANVDLGAPGQGGGVYTAESTATLRNTIIALNLSSFFYHTNGSGGTSNQDNSNDGGGSFDSTSSFNLIGAIDGMSGIDGGTNGNQVGSADAPLNPLLGPLTNNGGPTSTYLPQQFSPAIDFGSNALAVDQNNAALTTDQRGTGFPRILNGTVDIGAVETVAPPPPPPSANVGVTKLANVSESLADRDVVYTITVINAGPDAATTAHLVDTLPGNMTFVSLSAPPAGWSCTPTNGIDCTNPNFAAGSTVGFTLTGHIPAGTPAPTTYHNVATVSSNTADPDNSNDSYPADTTVVACVTDPVVTSNADSGSGSLRQATTDACDNSTIFFDMTQVVSPITLTTGELLINKNLTIPGPGANLLTTMRSTAGGTPDFRIFMINPGRTVSISGLTINNGKTAGDGGGVNSQGVLTLSSLAVTGNQSSASGGGIANGAGTMVITDSTISGNTGPAGGGIQNGGTLTIVNSTISGNDADGLSNSGTANLTNNTFSGNTVRGISNSGGATVNLRNTIVANTPGSVGDVDGAFSSQGNNFIGKSDGSTGFSNGVSNDKVGTVASPLNALLAALGNYGGPTPTHALLPGSLAINAADNCVIESAHCGDASITQLTADQRGLARQIDGTVDIGAFESRGFTISATSGTPQSTIIGTAFGAPLIATVGSAFGEPVNGGQVTFTAPGSGPSATFTGGVTTINLALNASGQVSASATANAIFGGPYDVTATGNGITAANFSLTNLKANQTITFGALANKTFGDPDFSVSASSSSGLPVSFSASGQCTVTSPSPGTVHLTGAGGCTITASQAGNASFNPAADVPQSFTISKGNQTITFGALANKTFGDPDFSVSATASSSLPVSFSATGNCTVTSPSPGTVHITGAGSCTITASQAGNVNYNAAPDAPQSFTINKANHTITFAALVNKTFGDPDFGVSATSSSGLTVSFSATGNCSVTSPSPGTVHITGAGSCTITASQAGNVDYNAAPDVLRSFNIAKAGTSTAVSSSVNPSDLNQSVTFTATVTSAAATPMGTVQFKDSAVNLGAPVALNAGGVAQFTTSSLTAGTHTITAEYSGDANFLAGTGTLAGGQVVKAQPSLSINDVSISEGNAGTKNLNFTVTLSAASNLTVSVGYILSDGTAKSPGDYQATSGALTFNPGVTTQTIPVIINGDVSFEPDETFTVSLANASNSTISDNQGTGTIQNDDVQGGFVSFSNISYNVNENSGLVTLTVVRTSDVSQAVNVDFATDDSGALSNCNALLTGLASQRCDFTTTLGTLKFAAGETQKTINVSITQDAYNEGGETFTVKLSNPTGGAALTLPSTAIVDIDDSVPPAPNPIDDTTTFVRQHYRDFLNREADSGGLAFWKDNIDKCNDPARRPAGQTVVQCIEVQRITTSASFFLSIEFQETGRLVLDFYVAALNRPATNNMPGFVEFMRDTQEIQRGVVVGQGNWQQMLDANRTAFMNEFVMRPEFVGLYPTTDTPTQYVDRLYQHANVPPGTVQERLDAILEFGGAPTAADPGARARALLRITKNLAFQAREFAPSFVQMQYFGYLRRDPDTAGFNFWVGKLNQFNGNFLAAEMVKAFLSSLEYRNRFGP